MKNSLVGAVFFATNFFSQFGYAQTVNTLKSTEDSVLVMFVISDLDSVPIENATLTVQSADKAIVRSIESDVLGKCYMLLPEGKTYTMSIFKFRTDFDFAPTLYLHIEKGRYSFDQNIRIKLIRDYSQIFMLENVHFDVSKWDIKPECTVHIDNLYNTLMINPRMCIEIAGHTDSDGDATENLILSQNRAESVMNYLIKMGLNPKRVQAKGYGEYVASVPNTSAENKAKNRRTEIRVLEEL